MRDQNGTINLQMKPKQQTQPKPPHTATTVVSPYTDEYDDDAVYNTRTPSNTVIRNQPTHRQIKVTYHDEPFTPRASRAIQTTQPVAQITRPKRRRNPLAGRSLGFYFMLLLVMAFLGYFLFTALVSFVQGVSDNIHYGYPRTWQTDKDVGHGGISHFTVENLQGHIFVFEIVGGDAANAHLYVGPVLSGAGADKMPAVLEFVDTTNDGRLDMVIDVDNTKTTYLNGTDGKFHPQTQGGS